MQVNLAVRHGELSADAADRVREKVEKLPRYFDRITAVYVTVDLGKAESPWMEIRATAEHTEDFVATSEAPSVSAALDGVLEKLETQLRRYKDRHRNHHGQGPDKHYDALPLPESESGDDEEFPR